VGDVRRGSQFGGHRCNALARTVPGLFFDDERAPIRSDVVTPSSLSPPTAPVSEPQWSQWRTPVLALASGGAAVPIRAEVLEALEGATAPGQPGPRTTRDRSSVRSDLESGGRAHTDGSRVVVSPGVSADGVVVPAARWAIDALPMPVATAALALITGNLVVATTWS